MTMAVLVPVGPSAEDEARLVDLLASVLAYAPEVSCCVLVDDALEPRDLRRARPAGWDAELVVVPHPRHGRTRALKGTHCAAVITGLQALHHLGVDIAIKLDLDALVIAPFAPDVIACARAHPAAGVIGSLGETCDPSHPLYRQCLQRSSRFRQALGIRRVVSLDEFGDDEARAIRPRQAEWVAVTAEQYRAFDAVRPAIERAVDHGLATQRYCQGGAYAMTSALIRRMAERGYLGAAAHWLALPFFGEDEMLAMHAYAVELELVDCSSAGEPFGVAYEGLPFSPTDLVARRHAIIHSVKNDARGSEADIRSFFAERRQTSRSCARA
jgi:hypothetical protein